MPAYGLVLFAVSELVAPRWHALGLWKLVSSEAKTLLFGYGTTVLLAHIILRARAMRASEIAYASASARAAEAQLHVLKLQLQPRGLLAAMHSVVDMIDEDPDAANEALVLLSELLRESIETARVQEVPLRDELALLDAVTRLRALRERRPFEVHCSTDSVLNALVPHLVLTTLLEALTSEACRLGVITQPPQISVRRQSNDLEVHMSVHYQTGRGIENASSHIRPIKNTFDELEARLSRLYGDSYQIRAPAPSHDSVEVLLRLPFREYRDSPSVAPLLRAAALRTSVVPAMVPSQR